MFTIKVTYGTQTRKYNFHIDTFPTFEQISAQLERVFSLQSSTFYLSKVLFSPDAAQSSRLLVARAIYNSDDYKESIRRLKGRTWPHPLLRFTILLGNPSNVVQQSPAASQDSHPISVSHSSPSQPVSSQLDICQRPDSPMATEFFANRATPTVITSKTEVQPPSLRSQHSSFCMRTNSSSCCSVAQGKEEVRALLSDFQDNLKRVIENDLGSAPSTSASLDDSLSAPPSGKACSVCDQLNLSNGWRCGKCNVMICNTCQLIDPQRFCLNVMGPHEAKPVVLEPFEEVPLPHLPQTWTSRPLATRSNQTPVIHRGVVCDACNQTIAGVRHKCLDCPDYDLCGNCIATGQAEAHNAAHQFFKVREPGRVVVHRVYDRAVPERTATPQPTHNGTVIHFARCDLCESNIAGDRYKCLVCPDYDTCSACFSITNEQHPGHSFIRIRKPEDFITRPAPRGTAKHFASCDSCRKTIHGARFKCMHPECPDYDLCQDCEALPIAVHPDNHPLLKMKSPGTVIPTVYRVGGTEIIPTSVSAPQEEVAPSNPPPQTPTSESLNNQEPVPNERSLTPEALPLLPPKPEMISTPSWASIPSFFGSTSPSFQPIAPMFPGSSHSDSPRTSERLWWEMDVPPQDPVATSTPYVAQVPIPPVIVTAPSNPVETTPKAADAPLPRAMVNPWPTTNTVERQELLQLIEEFGSTSVNNVVEAVADNNPAPVVTKHEESPAPTWPHADLSQLLDEVHQPDSDHHVEDESFSTISRLPILQRPASEPIPSTANIMDHLTSSITSGDRAGVEEDKTTDTTTEVIRPRGFLSAEFLEDVTVEDGSVFPPGAEFVKCWRLLNDGPQPWPESTQLVFVAGETLTQGNVTPAPVNVGGVAPGAEAELSTGDLKAPEVPGRYVSYWRLQAGEELFGNSLWIEIRVVEADSDSSMASSVIMPSVSSAPQSEKIPTAGTSSTISAMDTLSDVGSDDSGSLISMPDSEEEDLWHDIPSHFSGTEAAMSPAPGPAPIPNVSSDFVMLYDDRSSSSSSD